MIRYAGIHMEMRDKTIEADEDYYAMHDWLGELVQF